MPWQLILFDYVVIGIVVFVVGALAHKLEKRDFRPAHGWVLCVIGVVIFWPISVYGLLRAVLGFFLTLRKGRA